MRTISREFLKDNHVDGVLLSGRYNKYWLAGLNSGRGYVITDGTHTEVLVDGRYYNEMKNKHPDETIVLCPTQKDMMAAANAFTEKYGIQTLGLEGKEISHDKWDDLTNALQCSCISVNPDVLRIIKDQDEIACIRKACEIACLSLKEILPEIHEGVREKDIENILTYTMKKHGAEKESFDIIVASGLNGAFPHAKATDKIIHKGELVTIDFGCRYGLYCSDMTRTLAIGHVNKALKEIYTVVKQAHDAAMDAIRPGVSCKSIDAIARKVITDAGYGKYFSHNLGHSLGLEDHEEPVFSPEETAITKENMVMTDEPGIYVEGTGGVRIEDDVLITKDGHEILTDFSRELIEL